MQAQDLLGTESMRQEGTKAPTINLKFVCALPQVKGTNGDIRSFTLGRATSSCTEGHGSQC